MGYHLATYITVLDIHLTFPEVISLYFMRGKAQLFLGTEFEKLVYSAFAQMSFFMPEDFRCLQPRRVLVVSAARMRAYRVLKE